MFSYDPKLEAQDAADTTGLVVAFDTVAVKVGAKIGDAPDKPPEWREAEFIRITPVSDRSLEIFREVEPADKVRFAARYGAWKANKEAPAIGQPLAEWAPISRSEIETCRFYHVRTVEDLAAVPEHLARQMGPGYLTLSQRAADHIKALKEQAPLASVRAELEAARNRETLLVSQLEEMKQGLAELKRDKSTKKAEKAA